MEEWPDFPHDFLESRKHDIHVHLQILHREIDEIHEYLVHFQEPWISEGQLRAAIATWKKEDPSSWRTLEDLETQSTIQAMKSPGFKPDDSKHSVTQTVQTATGDHYMQKTVRKKHVGLGRTMSSSANKNQNNQASSISRTLSLKKSFRESISDTAADFKANIPSNLVKSQFARHDFANKSHYKSPDILSPGLKRSNTELNQKSSSTFNNNEEKNPGHSRSKTEQNVTTSTAFLAGGIMSPGQQISPSVRNQFASMSTHYKEPGVLSPPISRGNSRPVSPITEQNWPPIKSSHAPKFSFDQGNSDNTKPLFHQNGRVSPGIIHSNTTSPNGYSDNQVNPVLPHSKTLARKPSIATILPGPDGRYRPENISPESQTRRNDNYPIRSTSLDRRASGSKNFMAPTNTNYSRPPPPVADSNARFVAQDSQDYYDGSLSSPDYGHYDRHDMRSQYSQSQYSQYPSQIRGNTDFENFGLNGHLAVPPIPPEYMNTTSSIMSSSSVPLGMYPPTPKVPKMPNLAQPSPNNPQYSPHYNKDQFMDSRPQYDDIQDHDSAILNEYDEPAYQESRYNDSQGHDKHQDQYHDEQREHQRNQSSSTTSSQRAARRVTIWDGANGFVDQGSMPVIEESPRQWGKDRERDEKLFQEKNFNFSSFLSDLTKT